MNVFRLTMRPAMPWELMGWIDCKKGLHYVPLCIPRDFFTGIVIPHGGYPSNRAIVTHLPNNHPWVLP